MLSVHVAYRWLKHVALESLLPDDNAENVAFGSALGHIQTL